MARKLGISFAVSMLLLGWVDAARADLFTSPHALLPGNFRDV